MLAILVKCVFIEKLHHISAQYIASLVAVIKFLLTFNFFAFYLYISYLWFFVDATVNRELEDLKKYISMLLKRSNISVLSSLERHCSHLTDLESKYTEMDAIGVPYGIILDTNSLKTGLIKLRNRDTTIAETMHISYIQDYLPKIFQA